MISISDLFLQSSPQQEITGFRSRLLYGQFCYSVNSGTSWECRFNSRVTLCQQCAGTPYCWKMMSLSEIWRGSDNNSFKDIFSIIHGLFLLTDVWKHFLSFYTAAASIVALTFVYTRSFSEFAGIWMVNIFCPQTTHNPDFIFLAIFSDAHKQQVSAVCIGPKLDLATPLSLQRIFIIMVSFDLWYTNCSESYSQSKFVQFFGRLRCSPQNLFMIGLKTVQFYSVMQHKFGSNYATMWLMNFLKFC